MKKIIAAAVAVLLGVITVFFSGCDALVSSLQSEEETTLPFSTSRTEDLDSKDAIAAYYNDLLTRAKEGRAGVSRETRYEISDLQIVSRELEGITNEDGSQQSDPDLDVLNAAAQEVRAFIANAVKSSTVSAAFGEEWGEAAPNDIDELSYVEDASCIMGEETTEEGDTEIVYTNYYYGDLSFRPENYPLAVNSVLATVFPYPDEDVIVDEMAKMDDYIVLQDYDCVFEDNTINFSSDRITDQIDYANYTSVIRVTAHAQGVGQLADYGELTVYFTLRCANNYTFDWVDPTVTVA